jgi:hypothetical protein
MSDSQRSPEPDGRRPRRARRRAKAIVAQYIHELSERHREEREAAPEPSAAPAP